MKYVRRQTLNSKTPNSHSEFRTVPEMGNRKGHFFVQTPKMSLLTGSFYLADYRNF